MTLQDGTDVVEVAVCGVNAVSFEALLYGLFDIVRWKCPYAEEMW